MVRGLRPAHNPHQRPTGQQARSRKLAQVEMQYVQDCFDQGSVVTARLTPGTLGQLEPVLRRLLCGNQQFVKQADGTYRPRGSELGLPRYFEFTDLQLPALREQQQG
jgi:hypothetical protein